MQKHDGMRPPSRIALLLLLVLANGSRAELTISGVDGDVERNVRNYVSLASEPCDAESWLVRRRYRAIEADTRKALEPFGYYEPVIQKSLEFADACWQATLDIDPGPPVILRDVNISISAPPGDGAEFAEFTDRSYLVAGDPLRHAQYETLKESLQVRAAERGYVEAEFTENVIDVWPEEGAADIDLEFSTGPRYDFGDISIEQDFLDPALARAFLDFQTGTPFDSRELNVAYSDLSLSGYFSRIELSPLYSQAADGKIPVHILLEPAARIEYTVGAGYSTDTGPRLRAGYHNRRVNPEGHRFSSDLTLSPVFQGLTSEYRKPLSDPRTEWQSYTGGLTVEDTDTFSEETARVGLRRSKRIHPQWMRTLSLNASYDRYDVGEEGSERIYLTVPGIVFDHKRADREIMPTRGRRLTLELRGTSRILGSGTSFLQATVTGRLVRTLPPKGRLIMRANFGMTAKSEFDELPPSVRFFAGGDQSVRGYGFQTLGPKDEFGNVIGGSNLLVTSVEYERHVKGNWYGAVFVDAGNAFESFDVDPAIGVGFGVRWQSPVGPLRVYLAHPLNKSDRAVRVHVVLGSDL